MIFKRIISINKKICCASWQKARLVEYQYPYITIGCFGKEAKKYTQQMMANRKK